LLGVFNRVSNRVQLLDQGFCPCRGRKKLWLNLSFSAFQLCHAVKQLLLDRLRRDAFQ
jgi:hypothetical protein